MRLRLKYRPSPGVEVVTSHKCSEEGPSSIVFRKRSLVPSLFFTAFLIGFLSKWHQLVSLSSRLGILQDEQKERASRLPGIDLPIKTTPFAPHDDDGLQPQHDDLGATKFKDRAPHNQNYGLGIKEHGQKISGDRTPAEDGSIPITASKPAHQLASGSETDGGSTNNLHSFKNLRETSSIVGIEQQKGNNYPLAPLPSDSNEFSFAETWQEISKRTPMAAHPVNSKTDSSWNPANNDDFSRHQGALRFQRQKRKFSVAVVAGVRNGTKAITEMKYNSGWRNRTQSQHHRGNRATGSYPVVQNGINMIETMSTLPVQKAAAPDQGEDEAMWERSARHHNLSEQLVQPAGNGAHHNIGNNSLDAKCTTKSHHSNTENKTTHHKNGYIALDVEDTTKSNHSNIENETIAVSSCMAEAEVREEAQMLEQRKQTEEDGDSQPAINSAVHKVMASLWNKSKLNQRATSSNVKGIENASENQLQLSNNLQPAVGRTIHNNTNAKRNVADSRVQGFQRQRGKFSVTVLAGRNTTKVEETKVVGVTMGVGESRPGIAVFYNLFIPFNQTGDKLQLAFAAIREQIGQIGSSTQSKVLLNIVNIGQPIEEELVQDICASYKHLTCTRKRYYEKGFEDLTLAELYGHCQDNGKDEVIYMHNKGSFHSQLRGGWGYIRQDVWRRMGTMAAASEMCLKPLNGDTCDFCGLVATPLPWLHVPGNFWSARCSYIQKLLHPQNYQTAMNQYRQEVAEPYINNGNISMIFQTRGKRCFGDERWAAENWIGSHPSVRPCDLASVSDISHWQKVDRNCSEFSFSLAPRQNMEYMMSKSLPRIPPRVLKRPYLRLRDYHLLGGMIHRWQRFYNLTTGDIAPWVWKYYPDAHAWQEALENYGNRAFEVVTSNISS